MDSKQLRENGRKAQELIDASPNGGMTTLTNHLGARRYREHYEIESTVPGGDGKILIMHDEIVPFFFAIQELLRKSVEEFLAKETQNTTPAKKAA